MKVIFDVGHPAQVHNFKHLYWELEKRGHKTIFIAKDKEITKYLLDTYDLEYIIIGKTEKNIFRKILGTLRNIVIKPVVSNS